MTPVYRLLCLFALAAVLTGCSIFDVRDESFARPMTPVAPPRDTLVLIGGNSECSGDKGLWANKEPILRELQGRLGAARPLSTVYFAWTGDDPQKGTCLPDHLLTYLNGQERIRDELRSRKLVGGGGRLIVIGWSNGGKTAVELSRLLLAGAGDERVDLLITLDPVSRPTGGPKPSGARLWLNVYVQSVGLQRLLDTGNIIAWIGGAWNDFGGHRFDSVLMLNDCIAGNHRDVLPMWEAVAGSRQFADWLVQKTPQAGALTATDIPCPPR